MVTFYRIAALAALTGSCLSAQAVVAPRSGENATALRGNLLLERPLFVRPGGPAQAPAAAVATGSGLGRNEMALRAYQDTARKTFSVSWDQDAPTVRTMAAGRSRVYSGEPVVAARSFVGDARPFFGADADPNRLDAGSVRRTEFGPQVTFRQTVNGVPVLDHDVAVTMTDGGEVIMAENTTGPVGAVDTTPSVSALTVAGRARGTVMEQPELFVDASGLEPRLVWKMTVQEAIDRLMRVTVDAHTGEWLESDNLVQHATGKGMVYPESPKLTPTLVQKDLNSLDGTGFLTGLYTKSYMYGETSGTVTPFQTANKADLNFSFAANTTEQSQTQAYWGITTAHDYFKSTFNFAGRDHQIPALVRIPELANAFFYSGTSLGGFSSPYGLMAFGYAAGGTGLPVRDFAADTDVLVHEYTHAIVQKQNSMFANAISTNEDRGGISEGNADYFAGAIVGNTKIGEYAAEAFGMPFIRDMSVRNHYPEEVQAKWWDPNNQIEFQDYAEEHVMGEMWGSALWDLRLVLGAAKADQLIFKGVSLLSGGSLFQSALAALLTADSQLYGSANTASIEMVFNGRGIEKTAYPVRYLTSSSFYQSSGASKVRIGAVYVDNDGRFHDGVDGYFYGQRLFPSFVVDRYYVLEGYITDSTIQTVALELKDAAGTFKGALLFATQSLPAYNTIGAPVTYKYIGSYFGFSSADFPQDLTGLKLYMKSFTQNKTTVQSQYTTLTAKATAPTGTTTYGTQILHAKTTPVFGPSAFGDTDNNTVADLRDALLVIRALNGKGTLTAEQKTRSDVVEPKDGNPTMADARAILQTGAGLR